MLKWMPLLKNRVMKQLGLEIERFGPASICIRGIPAVLGDICPKHFIDLLNDLENFDFREFRKQN